MATNAAFSEVIDFICKGKTAEEIIAFRPSAAAQRRVEELIEKKRESRLTEAEEAELEDHFQLEHLLVMAKAHASRDLASRAS